MAFDECQCGQHRPSSNLHRICDYLLHNWSSHIVYKWPLMTLNVANIVLPAICIVLVIIFFIIEAVIPLQLVVFDEI